MTYRKARARPKRNHGQMNKTEARYLEQIIKPALLCGDYVSARFESIKLRLADRTFYTPDFQVITKDGEIEFHEVKGGFIEDDAMVKFKVAAEQYPEFRWILVQQKTVKSGWSILIDK